MSDANLPAWRRPDVVSYYTNLTDLTACERSIFPVHFRQGMTILDIGVGAGRTTSFLKEIAGHYVGIDYSEKMIDACRCRFPELEFHVMDATDMSTFRADSFDAILFSFNGIDSLHPDEKRLRCLRECYRILRSSGTFVFSAHSPKALLFRHLFVAYLVPSLKGSISEKARGILRAVYRHGRFDLQAAAWVAFLRGQGYVNELASPTRRAPSVLAHVSTPRHVEHEMNLLGFKLVEIRGSEYPKPDIGYVTQWYYYVFTKQS